MRSTFALLLAVLGLGGVSNQSSAAPASAMPPTAAPQATAGAPTVSWQIVGQPKQQTGTAVTNPGAHNDNTAPRRNPADAVHPYDVRAELALAQAELSQGKRAAAERRLDAAATWLLNSQAAARARLGVGMATTYDKSVDEVLSAFKATRSGLIGTARTMIDAALDSLKSSG